MTAPRRALARAAARRFARETLTPAELALEIERYETLRAGYSGDLRARDFADHPEPVIRNAIAVIDVELAALERQAKRLLRGQAATGEVYSVDFDRARHVDLVGLAETITGQAARKSGQGRYLMRCPFHEGDREPSLTIFPPGQGWACFGCGKAGQDAASFCAEFFDCTQLEGLRWVEQLADVPGARRAG